jgi:4-amino-4-deoxy-L-arabinose transferase-like glycosyltransferase
MSLKNIVFSIGFIVVILISFGVKLIDFDYSYTGFHLIRQLDNLTGIENYFLEGIQLKRRLVSGGYVVYEFPFYQALVAFLSSSMDEILFVARSVNLVFSFVSIILIFKIANIWFDMKTVIYFTLFFSFSPLNLTYHSAIMMDIFTIFFCLAATWLLIEYFIGNSKLWHLPFFDIAAGLSVVTKPLYFFPEGATALANYFNQYRSPYFNNFTNYIKKNLGLFLYFIIVLVIMFWWVGMVKSSNGAEASLFRLLSDWSYLTFPKYYALLVFRFTLLFLNPFTFLLFIVGILFIWKRYRDRDAIALSIFIPLYFIFFGNLSFPHEYYALITVPYCSIVASVGSAWLEEVLISSNLFGTREWEWVFFCVFSSIISALVFFLNLLEDYPKVEQKTVQIEQEMSSILEPKQFSKMCINRLNFPIIDYIKYNRSLYFLYVLGVRSEVDIRVYG